jgi:multidrug efflux system membrane fusion protein
VTTPAYRRAVGRWIGAAAVAVGGASLLAVNGCNKADANAAQQQQRPPAAVTVAAASAADVPLYLDEIGRVVPVQAVRVIPQVGGRIVKAHVRDGAYVTKGQTLFEIDTREYNAMLASARASVAQAKADLELAKIEFRRVEELRPQNAVSQIEYDQKKNAVDVADAKVKAAEAQADMAQINLDYTTITSPITGRAGAVLVQEGNVVKANEGELLVIQQLDPIYAEFTINETNLNTVRGFIAHGQQSSPATAPAGTDGGLRVMVDVPAGQARQGGGPGAGTAPATAPAQAVQAGPREGTLTFLDNTVQESGGTVKLRALLQNQDNYFWPGQFVNVRLVLTVKKDAVLVPSTAQQLGQQGPFVFVVTDPPAGSPPPAPNTPPTGVAQIRPIKPGQRQGDMIVVDEGLKAGERVIVTGQMMVQPGGPVMVLPPPPAPGDAPNNAPAGPATQPTH